MNALALLRPVLGMLSPEAKGLIVAVVELAKGAGLVGPPSPPPHVVQWSRNVAGSGVPWQLVAAALAVERERATASADVLVEAVTKGGLVPGVVSWAVDETTAERMLLAFLALTARGLDAEGLDALTEAFG